MANETIGLVEKLYEQGRALTAQWVLGRRGVAGNEIADTYEMRAVETKTPAGKLCA